MKRLQHLQNCQRKWSDWTFDDGKFRNSRSLPISNHLHDDVGSLRSALEVYTVDPSDATIEDVKTALADTFLNFLDCAAHVGFSVESLYIMSRDRFNQIKDLKHE